MTKNNGNHLFGAELCRSGSSLVHTVLAGVAQLRAGGSILQMAVTHCGKMVLAVRWEVRQAYGMGAGGGLSSSSWTFLQLGS